LVTPRSDHPEADRASNWPVPEAITLKSLQLAGVVAVVSATSNRAACRMSNGWPALKKS
jgi:hypothetical protein